MTLEALRANLVAFTAIAVILSQVYTASSSGAPGGSRVAAISTYSVGALLRGWAAFAAAATVVVVSEDGSTHLVLDTEDSRSSTNRSTLASDADRARAAGETALTAVR